MNLNLGLILVVDMRERRERPRKSVRDLRNKGTGSESYISSYREEELEEKEQKKQQRRKEKRREKASKTGKAKRRHKYPKREIEEEGEEVKIIQINLNLPRSWYDKLNQERYVKSARDREFYSFRDLISFAVVEKYNLDGVDEEFGRLEIPEEWLNYLYYLANERTKDSKYYIIRPSDLILEAIENYFDFKVKKRKRKKPPRAKQLRGTPVSKNEPKSYHG